MHDSTTYTTATKAGRRTPRLAAAVATAIGLVAVVGTSAHAQIDGDPAEGDCGQKTVAGPISIDLAPLLGPYVDPGPELAALLRGEVPMGVDCSADPTGAAVPSREPNLTDVPVWPNWPV